MKYTRRPFLMGNTASPVVVQPFIIGSIAKDDDGNFDFPGGGEIILEDRTSGEVAATFADSSMDTILETINAIANFIAEDVEGCLKISTVETGATAFIRVIQCADSGSRTGPPPEDVASLLGFPTAPNPSATVRGGDLESAPVRPTTEGNPPGTSFIARGEDRIARNYNRALHTLGANADALHTLLSRRIAAPKVYHITPGGLWNARLVKSGDNDISQVNISFNGLPYYIGGLTAQSSLNDIAKYFAVVDFDDKEMLSGDTVIRVGAVTRGQAVGAPNFAGEYSTPTGFLGDTQDNTPAPDGLNALGVDRIKQASTSISEIRQRTILVCVDALFETAGIVAGDTATISGSSLTLPINHNGAYLVEAVLSETELSVRPINENNVAELNPGPGDLGEVVVSSGGSWEANIWLTLIPPIPRWPEIVPGIPAGRGFQVVVGAGYALGDLPEDALLGGVVRTSEEVDAWVIQQLWRRQSLQGAYDGMGNGNGGGSRAYVSDRAATFINDKEENPSDGVTIVSGSGTIESGNVLIAEAADTFLLEYVGCGVLISGVDGARLPFFIDEWVDGSKVRLVPSTAETALELTVGAVTYFVKTNQQHELPATITVVVPNTTIDSSVGSPWGVAVVQEHTDTDTAVPPVRIKGFTHLERLKIGYTAGGAPTDLTTVSLIFDGTNTVATSINPEAGGNIFPEDSADLRTVAVGYRPGTLLRVLNGAYAGFYRIIETHVGPNQVVVLNLDGIIPSFLAGNASGTFYNVHFGTGLQSWGGTATPARQMGMFAYADSLESGGSFSPAFGLNWRGYGAGIVGVINDPELKSYDDGVGAHGEFSYAEVYAPATGHYIKAVAGASGATARRTIYGFTSRVFSNAMDWDLESGAVDSYDGWAGSYIQAGKDPALVTFKYAGNPSVTPTVGSFLSPAAHVLGYGGAHIGRGGALELIGSIYQWADIEGETTFNAGGIYSEVGIGAGRWLSPMYGRIDANDQPYEGTGTFLDEETPTQLGQSGQLLPSGNNDALRSGSILAPNYSVFNYAHWGRLKDTRGVFERPVSQYVGTKVKVDEDSTDGTLSNKHFMVMGVHDDGTNVHLALRDTGEWALLPPAVLHAVTYSVHGQRWYRGYVDIADWTRIGTRFDPDDNWKTPILTVGQYSENAVARAAREADSTVLNINSGGLLSPSTYWPRTDGEGLGKGEALTDMAVFELVDNTEIPAWNVGVDSVTSAWARDNGEPRTPFANTAIITTEDGRLDLAQPGSLVCDEVALEHIVMNSNSGMQALWTRAYGGAFMVLNVDASHDATDSVRLWFRGTHGFPTLHYGMRVTIIVARAGGLLLTAALRQANGDVVTSGLMHFVNGANVDAPMEATLDLTRSDLADRAFNALEAETWDTAGIHLTLDLNFEAETAPIYFIKVQLDQIVRPAKHIGALDVAGAVRAHSYRYMSPVRGFQTVQPAHVQFLNSSEYAKLFGQKENLGGYGELETRGLGIFTAGDEYQSGTTGMHEVHPGQTTIRPVFDVGGMFRVGPHAATIVLDNPAFDPLYYALKSSPYAAVWDVLILTANYIAPGQTGFILPLEPPHGSRLTSFNLSMSFTPCFSIDRSDGNTLVPNFQVWKGSNTYADQRKHAWRLKETWDAREGVEVRIYRYNALDIRTELESSSYVGTGPEYGWAELIYDFNIDLSTDANGAPIAEPTIDENSSFSTEFFVKKAINLHQEVAATQLLMVDRRQYGYFAVASFWGGCRSINVDPGEEEHENEEDPDALVYGYATDDNPFMHPAGYSETGTIGVDLYFNGVLALSDVTNRTRNRGFFPAKVKFRGARLGWETDRGGNGGWG